MNGDYDLEERASRQTATGRDSRTVLLEQTRKLGEVLTALEKNFPEEDIQDEISFLSIVKEKLEDYASFIGRDSSAMGGE